MKLKYFSGFSGIGGFDQGITQVFTEAECVGYSEIDKYAVKIYDKHFPDRTNYGNIKEINEKDLPDFNMFVGGFPCQPFSIAGKRLGVDDCRGDLFWDILRILKTKQPAYVLLENVLGLLSSKNEYEQYNFDLMMEELCAIGYAIDFTILNSKYFGVPQNRERVFILAIRRDLLSEELII